MQKKVVEQERVMNEKLANLSDKQHAEKQEIVNAFNVEKQMMEGKLANIQVQMLEAEEYHKQQQEEMIKIIEKKNYESYYPIPENLANTFAEHRDCFAIQILGKLLIFFFLVIILFLWVLAESRSLSARSVESPQLASITSF